jgi:2-haloacid dehalogenase
MMERVRLVVFDVNETLSDSSPLARRFADVGAPEHLAGLWFTTLLRDGFALAAADTAEPFAVIGHSALRTVLAGVRLERTLPEAVDHIMAGFASLDVHPDVVDGVRALRAQGLRLVTLSNGSASVAERLLSTAGIRDEFELLLSVEEAGLWKPARAAYAYAAAACGTAAEEMLLVAVHPWDVDGAARAGMQSAWLDRGRGPYPEYLPAPGLTALSLPDLADQLERATQSSRA